jgi:DNA-directed RNA polymerase subunit RPC12/RpoP
MVEEAEETKLCKNCEKQIASSKFRMHEVQCARINYKCKDCGMIVAKSDKEEHEANEHVKVQCQHCQFEALSSKFGNHEETCEKRPRPCRWCNEMQRFA